MRQSIKDNLSRLQNKVGGLLPSRNNDNIENYYSSNVANAPGAVQPMEMPISNENLTLEHLEISARNWVAQRKTTISLMEDMISRLNTMHTRTTKTKIGGKTTGVVGVGAAVGGIVLAPVTGGLSLLAVAPGLAVGTGSFGITAGAAITEWAVAKRHLRTIQTSLEEDTKFANIFLQQAATLGEMDKELDSKVLNLEGNQIKVVDLVLIVGNADHARIEKKNNGFNSTNVKDSISIGAKVLVGFVPIITIPLDLMVIADHKEALKNNEPSALAEVLVPAVQTLKEQLNRATGVEMTPMVQSEQPMQTFSDPYQPMQTIPNQYQPNNM